MIRNGLGPLSLGIACVLAGCNLQPYRPQPLEPERTASEFVSRRPDSPALRDFLERHGAPTREWPQTQWDLRSLTLAAVYFHPDLDAAQAEVAAQEAALAGASRSAAPVAKPLVEHHERADPGQSRWSYGLELEIPLSAAGKTEARVEQARARLDAARAEEEAAAWRVRSRLRQRFVEHYAAVEGARLDEKERNLRAVQAAALERRLALGAADAPEVSAARLRLELAELRVAEGEARTRQTLAQLAASLGLPLEAVAPLRFDFSALEGAPAAAAPEALREAALRSRSDIRLGLARYAAADAGLRLAVASQYPDVQLKPAYLWDQGDGIWALALGIPLQLLQNQEAPVREAEARRELEAQRFRALQAQVIADAASAATAYAASLAQLAGATRAQAAADAARARAARALEAGQENRVMLLDAEAQALEGRRARLAAVAAAQLSWSALQDAAQSSLDTAAPAAPLARAGKDFQVDP
ncbi:MAG TPA: TolC family protein [Burkholderiales bacterium]|nr:TolC family protein [Burkholderiales bacterium]